MSLASRAADWLRGLAFAWAAFAILVGCRSAHVPAAAADTSPIRYLLAGGPFDCDGGSDSPSLAASTGETLGALRRALDAPVEKVGSKEDLLGWLRSADPRPMVIVYQGHAGMTATDPPRTELCLPDGRLTTDDLLASIPTRTSYVVLVLDACFTAYVDVRKSAVPAAVIAASPDLIDNSAATTALKNALPKALREGDANGDGVVDDAELLQAMQEDPYIRSATRGGPALQLRRQAWSGLPVARLATAQPHPAGPLPRVRSEPAVFWGVGSDLVWPEGRAPCVEGDLEEVTRIARQRSDAEGFALRARGPELTLVSLRLGTELKTFPAGQKRDVVARVEAGDWARSGDGADGGVWIWHGGQVGARVTTVDGREFDGSLLLATPCDDAFGQCFVVRGSRAKVTSGARP